MNTIFAIKNQQYYVALLWNQDDNFNKSLIHFHNKKYMKFMKSYYDKSIGYRLF